MLTPHYRLAYIPTGSHSGGNGQRVINDQRDTINEKFTNVGIVAGVSKGLIQTIRVDSQVIADLVSVDIAINLMIASAWDKGTCAK